MKIIRVTTKEKPVLNHLQDAWIKPDDQDVLTESIIKWLKQNLHRSDVGLWVAIHEGYIVGCLMATGPSLLFPAVHIYAAWVKQDAPVKTKDFFEGPFVDWVRSMGCNEISICNASRPARVWERRYGFKGYSRIYRRSLDSIDLDLEADEVPAIIKESNHG